MRVRQMFMMILLTVTIVWAGMWIWSRQFDPELGREPKHAKITFAYVVGGVEDDPEIVAAYDDCVGYGYDCDIVRDGAALTVVGW